MKYIIEIKPEYEDKFRGVMILGAENSNLYVDSQAAEELEELNSDYINEHFGSLQDEAYKRGLEDGKAVNDKGCEGCKLQGTDSNICDQCCNSYANQWKSKDDKIVVGDEVEVLNGGNKYLIAWFAGTSICGFSYDGNSCRLQPSDVRKTGRRFDIQKILEEMKNE